MNQNQENKSLSANKVEVELLADSLISKEDEKMEIDCSENSYTLQQLLGRPLLSSTKLDPNDPIVPDKSERKRERCNPALRQIGVFIETRMDSNSRDYIVGMSKSKEDLLESGTGTGRKAFGKLDLNRNTTFKDYGKKNAPTPFSIRDLVEEMEKKRDNGAINKEDEREQAIGIEMGAAGVTVFGDVTNKPYSESKKPQERNKVENVMDCSLIRKVLEGKQKNKLAQSQSQSQSKIIKANITNKMTTGGGSLSPTSTLKKNKLLLNNHNKENL